MHRLSFFSLLFICIAVLADGKAPDGFVLIPKNPAFSFANAIPLYQSLLFMKVNVIAVNNKFISY